MLLLIRSARKQRLKTNEQHPTAQGARIAHRLLGRPLSVSVLKVRLFYVGYVTGWLQPDEFLMNYLLFAEFYMKKKREL